MQRVGIGKNGQRAESVDFLCLLDSARYLVAVRGQSKDNKGWAKKAIIPEWKEKKMNKKDGVIWK